MSTVNKQPDTIDSTTTLELPPLVRASVVQKLSLDGSTSHSAPPSVERLRGSRYLWQACATSLPLLLADQLVVAVVVWVVAGITNWLAGTTLLDPVALAVPLCAGHFLAMLAARLYPAAGISGLAELRRTTLATAVSVGTSGIILATFLRPSTSVLLGAFSAIFCLTLVGVPLARRVMRQLCSRFDWWAQPVLIFGGNHVGAAAYRALASHRESGLRPLGIVGDWHEHWDDQAIDPEWYLGSWAEAGKIAQEHGVYWGVVTIDSHLTAESDEWIDSHVGNIPHILILAQNSSTCRHWAGAQACGGLVGMRVDERLLLPGPQLLKRALDLICTISGGLLLLPLIVALAVAVRLTSPGPAFYSQERIGRGRKKFRAWKFRSMVLNADQVLKKYLSQHPELQAEWDRDHKLKDDPRVTKVGWFLRKTSLDELPQIWNVIRGEMSLVGPRPIVEQEATKYAEAFPLYLRVRPGITGLWQINGRNNTTYQERVHYDVQYVRNWSPWLDTYILINTVEVVLRCKGAY